MVSKEDSRELVFEFSELSFSCELDCFAVRVLLTGRAVRTFSPFAEVVFLLAVFDGGVEGTSLSLNVSTLEEAFDLLERFLVLEVHESLEVRSSFFTDFFSADDILRLFG